MSEHQKTSSNEITVKEIILKIKDWFYYLKTKWIWIVVGGVIGGTIGLYNAYKASPTYTAALTFALEDEKSGSGAAGLASQLGFDIGAGVSGAFSGSNIMELMKSRLIVEKTLLNIVTINKKKTSLADFFVDFNGWRNQWANDRELNKFHFSDNVNRNTFTIKQDSILGLIYSNLVGGSLYVEQKDKKASIITIEVKSGNEYFAKFFAEALAKEVTDFYIETKTKKTSGTVKILEFQADSIRTELNAAISSVAVAVDNNFNLNAALNLKRIPSQKKQIDVQVNLAILTEMVKNLELSRMNLRKETPLIQVIDKPILPLPKDKLSKRKGLTSGAFLGAFFVLLFFIGERLWKILVSL